MAQEEEVLVRLRRHVATPAPEGVPAPEPVAAPRRLPIVSAFLVGEDPWRLPLFAAIAVGLILGAALRFRDIPQTAVVAVYVAVLVSCAATDLATFRVLNVITYPAIVFAFLVGAFMPGSDFVETIVGGALAGGLMLLALIISRGAMGLGDVKLLAMIGAFTGWLIPILAIFLASPRSATPMPFPLIFLDTAKEPILALPRLMVRESAPIIFPPDFAPAKSSGPPRLKKASRAI